MGAKAMTIPDYTPAATEKASGFWRQLQYRQAKSDRLAFWAETARSLEWMEPWDLVHTGTGPESKWFVGGKLNASANCLDRHLRTWRQNKAAIIFEGEPGDSRVLTYRDLHREVTRFAGVLLASGVRKGDIVTIYLPLIPELPIAMLACARIGAPHNVVFGGFSAAALAERIHDTASRLVITADGGWRRGKIVPLKENVDQALTDCPTVEQVITVRRTGHAVPWQDGRDRWYHECMEQARCAPAPAAMDAEDPLFVLYTSGTTGKPKGIVHSTGGYLVSAGFTHRFVFDPRDEDVYWCTADLGWITGHSYVLYGPLANGATTVLYEGAPDCPDESRIWSIVEKYGVTILYTAPTLIRSLMKWGDARVAAADLSSLRLLGSVGEPLNPAAYEWYRTVVGKDRCPIVDTWWQTETGMIILSPIPGLTPAKPGSVGRPLPGVEVSLVDDSGQPVPPGQEGYLIVRSPWPAMLRGIHGNPERCRQQYWSRFAPAYFAGDGARADADGCIWITGRVDDVIKVAGHRLSTAEIESALVSHPAVAEAAVIGAGHPVKGQSIAAFVVLRSQVKDTSGLTKELQAHVANIIGKIARPDLVTLVPELPKTRSGKIMRRLLQNMVEGKPTGDTTTLADPGVIAALRQNLAAGGSS